MANKVININDTNVNLSTIVPENEFDNSNESNNNDSMDFSQLYQTNDNIEEKRKRLICISSVVDRLIFGPFAQSVQQLRFWSS